MAKETEDVEFLIDHPDDYYTAYIKVGSVESTFGMRRPTEALMIYTFVSLLTSAGILYNVWMHNLLGVLLFVVLRILWTVKGRSKLGIPEAQIEMVERE